jgi:hypothetical protein
VNPVARQAVINKFKRVWNSENVFLLFILTFCHYRGCGGKLTNRPNRILLICSNFGKGEKIFWLNMKFVALVFKLTTL